MNNSNALPLGPNNAGIEVIVVDDAHSIVDKTIRPVPEPFRKQMEEQVKERAKWLSRESAEGQPRDPEVIIVGDND